LSFLDESVIGFIALLESFPCFAGLGVSSCHLYQLPPNPPLCFLNLRSEPRRFADGARDISWGHTSSKACWTVELRVLTTSSIFEVLLSSMSLLLRKSDSAIYYWVYPSRCFWQGGLFWVLFWDRL
jgi:hypothetical protein